MAVERSTVRRARKERPCSDPRCPDEVIKAGDLYMEHVIGPGHPEVENERWLRNDECARSYHDRTGRTLASTATGRKD